MAGFEILLVIVLLIVGCLLAWAINEKHLTATIALSAALVFLGLGDASHAIAEAIKGAPTCVVDE